tara:strand:+ start:321 stop:1694 length:1374 start_codon:yes stop_codon:yes gene_type:complete
MVEKIVKKTSNNKIYFDDKNFFIRSLKNTDINNNYLNWFKKKNNTKYIVHSSFKELKDLKAYYINEIKKKSIFFGIFESKTNKHIGNIKFQKINLIKKTASVGIFLGNTSYQNKGLGSKSLIIACNLMYEKFKIFKIQLGVIKNNLKAINSYKNSGFYVCENTKKNKIITLKRNYFLNKITIGTANFGNNYGIVANKKISKKEQNKIFLLSNKFNIPSYDLAEAYNLNFKLINKKIPKNSKIYLKLLESFKNFNIKKILRLKSFLNKKGSFFMIHGFNKVINFKKKSTKNNLTKLSKILPLGISVYSPSEIRKAYKFFKFEAVQAPANIFDQRFLSRNMLRFFKKNNIQFCARSIYLQGVLLQNKKFIKKNFPQFYDDFSTFFNQFSKNLNSRKKLITHFIFQNVNIDKIVVGFENSHQLKDLINILDNFYNLEKIKFSNFRTNKLKLIDPTNWVIK